MEAYSRTFGLDYTILRYGSLYGPRSSEDNWMRSILVQALKEGKIVRKGDGDEIREHIHVYDASKLTVKVLEEQMGVEDLEGVYVQEVEEDSGADKAQLKQILGL